MGSSGQGAALDAAQVGTFEWEVGQPRLAWSAWHARLWGFASDEFEVAYTAFIGRVHLEDRAAYEIALAARTPFRCEVRVVWPDGSERWICCAGDGDATRVRGVVMPATDGKRPAIEDTLRHERDFSDAVLRSLPGILYLYDREGRFLRWNHNFERVTGYSAAEIATMHPLQFFPPGRQDEVSARIAEVFAHGASSIEVELLAKDGTTTLFHFTGVELELGAKPCLVGVGIDVSARARAEARYRILFDYAPDGIVVADDRSYYLDANASACRMMGYAHDEFVGLHASDIVVPETQSQITEALREILAAADYHREWEFRRKDGSGFPADVMATLMPDGNLLAVIRDVSARKQAERTLRELNESLEHKVEDRTRELHAALERAEDADRLKSAFLATMSHELRTPLNSIIGFTGIVLKGMAGPLTLEQTKQLGMVRASARHLLALINDVLDLSKIEADQLEIHPARFDLRAVLEGVVALLAVQAEAKRLALVVSIEPSIGEAVTDRRRVEQIVINLLNNAIKFTDRGTVSLDAVVVDGRLRVRVRDTGIGIRAEDLATLFQPFHQIDNKITRRHEGTGLGLAICGRLTALLGGEVVATSTLGAGSEFIATIPVEVDR